jgi:putative transcription factor
MPANQVLSGGQDLKPQSFDFSRNQAAAAAANQHNGKVSEAQANKVRQTGGSLLISKKLTSGNQNHAGPGARARALDDDSESTRVATVSHDVKVEIQRARATKGMTQQELANAICERGSVVTEYENGKAIPNEGVLVKMEKALGVHLRGALAGQPFAPKPAPKK